ncbi:MAG: helix-turn-helix domain-containing protein [Clostridiales bacterium]|nr:helix-turn-helix domain-containing protein [Clostridiales bacterium]
MLTVNEKIRIMAKRNRMTLGSIADALGESRQGFSNKLSRNDFDESEIRAIAAALGAEVSIIFRLSDGTDL